MSDDAGEDDLAALRERLDALDASLVELLATRFAITREVGRLKRARGLPARDADREAQQLERLRTLAQEHGVDGELVEAVFRVVVDRVVAEHGSL